jgi:hypothetical protein
LDFPKRGQLRFAGVHIRLVRNRGASRNYAKTLAMGVCRVTTLRKFPKHRDEAGNRWGLDAPGAEAYQTVREGFDHFAAG